MHYVLFADLESLATWLPQEIRDLLGEKGSRMLALALVGVVILLLVVGLLKMFQMFARKRSKESNWDPKLLIELQKCPLPDRPAGQQRLTAHHVPVRVRLVVVAPFGKDTELDAVEVKNFLARVIPGLPAIIKEDRPRILVWPTQLSHHGFAASFHRHTRKAEDEKEPSRWILVAGRPLKGEQSALLGLGLWADEKSSLGRLTLEPHQWMDVLRVRKVEK